MPKVRKVPQRTCVGCGTVGDKRQFMRVVRTPDGQVVLDATGKKSGRGAYVCKSSECLARAIKGGRLARALEVEVPESIIKDLEAALSETTR
ncbi:MAG: YlxR family protein [Firmicutes bacterium]|jgi:predicted RNA-binding protein YlxR (DUF448 family)|nr:YlxR family protein [Bacillota bacterium]